MFGSDRSLEWLEDNKETAIASPSWDAFCDAVQPLGDHYRKNNWLRRHWEFLRARGFLMFKPIKYPEARSFTDLFSAAKMAQKSPGPDWYYLSEQNIEPSICGSYGGRRGWSKEHPDIRSHYGSAFYHVYVRVRPEIKVTQFFDTGKSSIHAIRHDNGSVLVTASSPRILADDWLAYLDAGDSLESLLPPGDREFLARERAADVAAWGE